MVIFFAFILVLMPVTLWAAPTQVTLFPNSAQVLEVSAITAEKSPDGFSVARLTLPGQADPATLSFAKLSGAVIADLTWTQRQEKNQAALTELNARLAELKAKRDALLADQESIQGRMNFWKAQTKPAEQSLAIMRELAAELAATLRADAAALSAVNTKVQEVDEQIAVVEKDIKEAAGVNRKVWSVDVLFSGDAPKELTYAYTMRDCGWLPLYRLEALPAQEKIKFSWQAKVWQRSGQGWNQVRLHLATMPPESQATPTPLPPWEIRLYEPRKRRAAASDMDMMVRESAPMMAMKSAAEPEKFEPEEVRYTTYAAWDMGKRSLPAGPNRIFEIEQADWPAKFLYLFRPSLDTSAFVQAKVEFPEARELPAGSAFFLIDGATVDHREFSFSGKKETFFFGTDPFLSSETVLKDKKTGEKGIFKQKQSYAKEWTMILKNASDRKIPFRLEEAKPLVRDERIKLELAATPEPMKEEKPEILAWEGSLAPGAEQKFDITLKFNAPDNLHLDPGWHW